MGPTRPPYPPNQPLLLFEEEQVISLRPYFEVLLSRWLLISGVALTVGIVVFALSFLWPSSYTAESNISLLNIRSTVIFDDSFTTVPNIPSPYVQQDNRPDALLALAESPSLLGDVLAQLNDELAEPPLSLTPYVSAKIKGDLLQLRVTWSDPQEAALIANVWTKQYLQVVNRSFVNTGSSDPEEARQAAEEALGKYQVVQDDLEAFIATSELKQRQHEIRELETLLNTLYQQRSEAMTLLNSTSISSTTELANATSQALLTQVAASVDRATADQVRRLDMWYAYRAQLERGQAELAGLEAQLAGGQQSGGAASGDYLALLLTRATLFGAELGGDSQLQLDLSQLSASGGEVTAEDVALLQRIVAEQIQEADAEIERLSVALIEGDERLVPASLVGDHPLLEALQGQVQALLANDLTSAPDEVASSPLGESLTVLAGRLQRLEAEVEELEARERELRRARDTAWTLYTTLDNKAREVEAQFATGVPQVRLAVGARVPTLANPRGGLLSSLMAAFATLCLAALFVVVRHYWGRPVVADPEGAGPDSLPQPWAPLDPLPEGVIILSPDKRLRYINPAARQLLHAPDGAVAQRPIQALRQPELAELVESLAEGEGARYQEILLAQGGRLLVAVRPLILRDPDSPHWLLMLQDISGVLRPATALEPRLSEVAQQVSGAPPANHLDTAPLRLPELLHLNQEMGEVIDQLALLEQAEAGIGERTPLHLKLLAQQVIAKLGPQAQHKGIDVKEELPANLPPLLANSEQLHHALVHLVDNAIKYSEPQTKVRLRAKVDEGAVTLAVLDSGMGIWVKDIPFLFDRYYRVESPEVQAIPGHGLGLAIVKAVVEAHGGRTWAESRPGSGSIFFIKLPLSPQLRHQSAAHAGNGNGSHP